jgi:transposase
MNEFNRSRLKEYRQLKKEIRGSVEHLLVGIDVAKEKHVSFFGTATGKTLFKRLIFENNIEGFELLLTHAEAIRVRNGLQKVVFGLEPTADYHKPLGEFLVKNGHSVVLASNGAVKHNRELLDGRWDKHDGKDACNVADLISQGKFLFYDYPCREVRDLRGLLSLKRKLKKQEHSIRMRIRNHLVAQYFPELDSLLAQREVENLAIVKWCLNPAAIAKMEFEKFYQLVTTRDRGVSQRSRLRVIWQTASNSIACEAGEAAAFEAKLLVEQLQRIRECISKTDAKIKKTCDQFPEYKYLLSIPGFGPAISAMTIGALGDPHRFNNGTQVLKLVGLDLSASRSGKKSDTVTPVISKKGKAELRYAMYQAALIATYRNKQFIEYFTRVTRGREREKGIKTKMRVKIAAKMLIIAWTLMKKKEDFDPQYLN